MGVLAHRWLDASNDLAVGEYAHPTCRTTTVQMEAACISPSHIDRHAGTIWVMSPRRFASKADSLRVLLVVESSGAGTGRHVLDLAEGLSEAPTYTLFIRRDEWISSSSTTWRLKNIRSLPLVMRTRPHPSDIGVVRAVKRYMREFGPFDVIHGHSSKGGAIARLAAVGTGVPAFYTLHGLIMMDPAIPRWKRLFYLTIERGFALRTSRIISVSPEEERAAIQLGFSPSKVMLIPNGIGELKLTPRHKPVARWAWRKMRLSSGLSGPGKAPSARGSNPGICGHVRGFGPCRLVVVGKPMDKTLRELAAKLGVEDQVIWLGARDARTVLAGFDVFAIASRKEGLPYVVLEAMSAGLPIVATSSAGVEILVISGLTGVVVPPEDVSAFARG